MSAEQQIFGDNFKSGGGPMNTGQDHATAIQINTNIYKPQQAAQQRIPRHLPPLDDHFVGRKEQLAEIIRQLQPGQIVTLCGPGGIGKSALAAQAIQQIEEERFPDGILFHCFYNQHDYKAALEYIAASFGIEPKPTPEAAAQIALAGKQALLMLDGTEEAKDLRPILKIRGANCSILITSRSRGDAGSIRLDLLPLEDEYAAKLLQAWSGTQLAHDISKRICELLGGLPLAIRLVGHYLSESGESSTEYLEWLEEQPIQALHHGEHRDQSVQVLLSRSLAQVSENAREVLAATGQLAFAPFSVDPIAAALELRSRDCRTALGELVKYGILQRVNEDYTVSHALIASYVRRNMRQATETLAKLTAYYNQVLKEYDQQGVQGFEQLHHERPHILALQQRCAARQDWQEVVAIAHAVERYLEYQGFWTELREVLKQAHLAAQHLEDAAEESSFIGALGAVHLRMGDYSTALRYLEESLAIVKEIGDKAGQGRTLNNISQIYKARGDYSTALRYLEESLAIQQEIGDKAGQGEVLNNLATTAYAKGDYSTALRYLEESLAIQQEIGDKAGQGTTLNNISLIYKARGDDSTALHYLKESLAIQQEIGDKAGEGTTLNNLSQIYHDRGDYSTALHHLEESLAIRKEIGDKAGQGTTLNNLSQIYYARGDDSTALRYLEDSLAIAQEIGDKAGEGTTLNNLSQIYHARGDDSTALDYLEESLAIAQEIGDKAGQGTTLNNLATTAYAKGDYSTALSYLEESLAIRKEIGDKAGQGTTLNNISLIYKARGDDSTALRYLEQSLAIKKEIGDKAGEATSCWNIGHIYLQQESLENAEKYIRRAVQIGEEIEHPYLKKQKAFLAKLRQRLSRERAAPH